MSTQVKYLRVYMSRTPGARDFVVPVEVVATSTFAGHDLATVRPVGGTGETRVRQVNLSDSLPAVGGDDPIASIRKKVTR